MVVTQQHIQQALRALSLQGQVVCLHSSLRSFGRVYGGAIAVVQAFLDEGCTVLVPTFSSVFEIDSPPHLQFERNGWNYSATPPTNRSLERVYTPEALDIDRHMGVIPAMVITWPNISGVIIRSTLSRRLVRRRLNLLPNKLLQMFMSRWPPWDG